MYTLAEKKELGELVNKYKEKYNKGLKNLEGKTNYNYKRKEHVSVKPKQGFIAQQWAVGKRCHEKYLLNDFLEEEEPSKKRFRESGVGRNEKVPEVREAMFQWFIDVGVSLKRCLLMKMFYPKCVQVYS